MSTRIVIITSLLAFYGCVDSNIYEEFWPNGNLKERRVYNPSFDREEGNYRVVGYDRTGNLSFQGEKVAGQKNGGWIFYYSSGIPKLIGSFREGIKFGEFEEYHEDGAIKANYTFNYVGRLDGKYTVRNECGQAIITGQYESGLLTGNWEYLKTEEGYKKVEYEYGNNELVTFERKYLSIEDTIHYRFIARNNEHRFDSVGEFKDGVPTGFWGRYSRSGEVLSEEGNYQLGLKQGQWKYWSADSSVTQKGLYASGLRVGLWEFSNMSGIERKEIFFDDQGERVMSYWYHNKQTIKDGTGYIDEIKREGDNEVRYRTYYKNGLPKRTTRKIIG